MSVRDKEKWISCENSLPSKCGTYMVQYKYGVAEAFWDGRGWIYSYVYIDSVSAWMPIKND